MIKMARLDRPLHMGLAMHKKMPMHIGHKHFQIANIY